MDTIEMYAQKATELTKEGDAPVGMVVEDLASQYVAEEMFVGKDVIFSFKKYNEVGGKISKATIDKRGVVHFKAMTNKQIEGYRYRDISVYHAKDFLFKTDIDRTGSERVGEANEVYVDEDKIEEIKKEKRHLSYKDMPILYEYLNDKSENKFYLLAIDESSAYIAKDKNAQKSDMRVVSIEVPVDILSMNKKMSIPLYPDMMVSKVEKREVIRKRVEEVARMIAQKLDTSAEIPSLIQKKEVVPGSDDIIYTTESGTEYSSNDIIKIANGNIEVANIILGLCEWQHPETVKDELLREGEILEVDGEFVVNKAITQGVKC